MVAIPLQSLLDGGAHQLPGSSSHTCSWVRLRTRIRAQHGECLLQQLGSRIPDLESSLHFLVTNVHQLHTLQCHEASQLLDHRELCVTCCCPEDSGTIGHSAPRASASASDELQIPISKHRRKFKTKKDKQVYQNHGEISSLQKRGRQ